MKKIISLMLTIILAVSIVTISTTASAATTTFNGKTAIKGGYVYATYTLKAPEKMEDIQAYVSYSKGLKLISTSYSKELQSGNFIHNEKNSNRIYFNAININKGMDFTKTVNLVKMKFKVTSTGKLSTGINLQCLDGKSGKSYGKEQKNNNYSKIQLKRVDKVLTYSIKLNKKSFKLKKGKTYSLKAYVTPSSVLKSFSWSTSNKKIVSITSKGKVKAKKKGSCYITCKTKDGSGKYVKIKITVK